MFYFFIEMYNYCGSIVCRIGQPVFIEVLYYVNDCFRQPESS